MSKSEIAKMEADGAAVKQFIETHWSGNAGDFTPRERACLAGLLGVANRCDLLRERIKETAAAIAVCEAAIAKRQADYDRLIHGGQRDAAGQAVSGIPQITGEIERLRGQAVDLAETLNQTGQENTDFEALRKDTAKATQAAYMQNQRLLLLDRARRFGEIHLHNTLLAIQGDADAAQTR